MFAAITAFTWKDFITVLEKKEAWERDFSSDEFRVGFAPLDVSLCNHSYHPNVIKVYVDKHQELPFYKVWFIQMTTVNNHHKAIADKSLVVLETMLFLSLHNRVSHGERDEKSAWGPSMILSCCWSNFFILGNDEEEWKKFGNSLRVILNIIKMCIERNAQLKKWNKISIILIIVLLHRTSHT